MVKVYGKWFRLLLPILNNEKVKATGSSSSTFKEDILCILSLSTSMTIYYLHAFFSILFFCRIRTNYY